MGPSGAGQESSVPIVPSHGQHLCQSCVVKGFIHLPGGCADKSPVITGNKAVMAIWFNILENFSCCEILFSFLRLKGID